MKLYFAHPFVGRKELRIFEQELELEYGIELVNPFYDTERNDVQRIDAGEIDRYDVDAESIVISDLKLIRDCDSVLAIINGDVSYGTIFEIAYASNSDIPVYALITNGHHEHPWLKYHCDKIFVNDGELKGWLLDGTIRQVFLDTDG